ncbi:MAG: hypothetical protein WC641_06830 [Patescibacteria group bacterium]
MTTNSITPGQKKQYLRFVEDAAERMLDEAGIDKDGIQRLIENGGSFQTDIAASIKRLSVSNQYAAEEVVSTRGYPSGYRAPKPFAAQVGILREVFPDLGSFDEALASSQSCIGLAEGNFAIPPWEKIAPTYGEAVEKVQAAIASRRKFYNYRQGQLGPQQLREHPRSIAAWQTLRERQTGQDILVVPAQFGLRHRGRSVRRAREVFVASEFGLGSYATGIMHLTHPKRLVAYEDLCIDCAGDEFAPEAGGGFYGAPYWRFSGDRLGFGSDDFDLPYELFGSASGFFPECHP